MPAFGSVGTHRVANSAGVSSSRLETGAVPHDVISAVRRESLIAGHREQRLGYALGDAAARDVSRFWAVLFRYEQHLAHVLGPQRHRWHDWRLRRYLKSRRGRRRDRRADERMLKELRREYPDWISPGATPPRRVTMRAAGVFDRRRRRVILGQSARGGAKSLLAMRVPP